ncbi:MAG: DUF3320 domain-containing protein [Candidatus Poribacteria bacterium]|nr:DUF3320 domain-containing protein [Candidatus Poribacteria bacterium]
MNTIQTKLDEARKELLDLSLRNPLINYRLLKARGLEVVDESPPSVYQILVQQGKVMSFLPKPELDADDDFQLFEEDDTESDPARHTDSKLQTHYSPTELQRRLLNTYYTARTAIEEQGVNTLYLALGMLEWYESESSDMLRRAPLVLIPVELSRASVRARFRIGYTEEEFGTNLSLQEKLKSEFGIHLPDLHDADDLDELDVPGYFQTVSASIMDTPHDDVCRWSVNGSAVALGFFSFAKFLMYRDLESTNWDNDALPAHSVLQSALATGFQEPSSTIPVDSPIDEHLNPGETHHVVDADSSQALAIHEVCEGRNLVIQGPPGTGKSQTITNLIAEAISNGKRVLFVAEKMAALEVVKRNLDKAGIGDACLELHSHKMNKKAVVDELNRTLALSRSKTTTLDEKVQSLLNNRDRLNNYCRAVNTPIGDSGITPFQAYGELLAVERRLSEVELPTLDSSQFRHAAADFAEGLDRIEELQILLKRMGIPIHHPFWGSRCSIFPPNDRVQVERLSVEAREAVIALQDASEKLAQHLQLGTPGTREAVESVMHAAQCALSGPNMEGVIVKSPEWAAQSEDLEAGLKAGARLSQLHQEYDNILILEAWEQSVLEIRKVLAAQGDKWWRVFSRKFRRARNELAGLCKQELPKAQGVRLRIVDAILESQREQPRLEKIQGIGKQLYGRRWEGKSSNWLELREIAQYLLTLHQSVERGEWPEALIDYLASNQDSATLRSLVAAVEEHYNRHPQLLRTVVEMIQLDETVRFGPEIELKARPFTEQAHILEGWEKEAERLQEIVNYNHLTKALKDSGFGDIVKVANDWPEASQFLPDLLKHVWHGAQVETAMRERPILAGFTGDAHHYAVERFKDLDRLSLEFNKANVAYAHRSNLPQYEASSGQLGLLRREFEKKRRHLPIRQLMTKAGNAIQAIKPVFMMSPLSVATFLPPNSVDFDWVVFDEASQVKPVDAFGAIIRGGQAVVVGDNRQLPPTRFFDKHIADDDEDIDAEDNLAGDMESILGLFSAQNAPTRMLRWHYRSRHESLITVSNIEFYENKLQLFPSPDAAKEEVGLIYHYLQDTAYDRGRSGRNKAEARFVAARVIEHARNRPNLTLGVSTFSTTQMEAVQNELELLRREDSSCEQTFFNAHPEEPFFVKNLENVQGDERDVIFISIGYGRDANGHLTMNFGPLNQDGGERRLNVLITRARRRCEVFTNLKGDDIDLSRTDARGVAALKRYLKYAETGDLEMPKQSDREAGSLFEEEVAEALRDLGYQVEHQIGSSGYFIDLGVKDPQRPGRYLLGIECDGATYHSAQSARDRDRLRQQVLEGLGWRIHRIWSTDWFRTRDKELRKAAEAIEAAKVHIPSLPEPASEDDSANSNNGDEEAAGDSEDTTVHFESESRGNSLAEKYKLAELVISTDGHSLGKVSPFKMQGWIQRVVEIESPVHFDEVARRIASAVGVSRVGNRIQDTVKAAARQAARSGSIEIRGDFFYLKDQGQVNIVRDRSELPKASRKLELIAPEEIEAAIKQVVSEAFGIESGDLTREVCKLFGFKSVSTEMRRRVELIIELMIEREELTGKGDSLVLA